MANTVDIRVLRLRRLNERFHDAQERHANATKAAMFQIDIINAVEREMATLVDEIKALESQMFDAPKEVE